MLHDDGIRFKLRRDSDLETSPIFFFVVFVPSTIFVSHGAKVGLYFAGVVWQWNLSVGSIDVSHKLMSQVAQLEEKGAFKEKEDKGSACMIIKCSD